MNQLSSIDLRSDTVTKACEGMRTSMKEANVGDSLMGEDPTVHALENTIRDYFGFGYAAFVPSGTMSNQILLRALSEPGDAVLAPSQNHIVQYEAGALAALTGLQLIAAESPDDVHIELNALTGSKPTAQEFYRPPLKIVAIENTSMAKAGQIYSPEELVKLSQVCRDLKIKLHVDGARLWHALDPAQSQAKHFGLLCDSLSVCLSKGLGAPVGSVALVQEEVHYIRLKRFQKMYGGCMRQAGHLAAAGLFAFQNNFAKLPATHNAARRAATIFENMLKNAKIHYGGTNIVLIECNHAPVLVAQLAEKIQVKLSLLGPKIARAVFHIDMLDSDLFERLENFDDITSRKTEELKA